MDTYNRHYISIESSKEVVKGFSDAFRQPETNDICINEQGSYQFRLFQSGEENPTLFNENGTPLYRWENGMIRPAGLEEIAAWEKVHQTNQASAQQIAKCKQQLTATDYQIIKCSECQLAGQPLPYDVAELHAERQALRDRINELETVS